jgi:hypothetical protein
MRKSTIILILLTTTALISKSINSKVIRANDGYKGSIRTSSHRSTKDDVILSTVEVSSQISVQLTSIASLDATSQDKYNNQTRRGRYAQLKFLKDNRDNITVDISKGDGEYLSTLLDLMSIEPNSDNLIKIQSNFENLTKLENREFLAKIEEIIQKNSKDI